MDKLCMNCNKKVCICNPHFYNNISTLDMLDKFSKKMGGEGLKSLDQKNFPEIKEEYLMKELLGDNYADILKNADAGGGANAGADDIFSNPKYGSLLKEMFESGYDQLLLQKSTMKLVNEIINNVGSGDDELSGQLIKEKEFGKEPISISKNKMTEDLQKENEMLKKELEVCRYENKCLSMKLKDYGNSEPPYVMSKLLDGLHIDSYQYTDDGIGERKDHISDEDYIDENEEVTINI